MSDEDRELLEAFGRRRDETSFRRLYRRHTPLLFGLAVRLTGSAAEAEELTQETWVRAVERHDRYGGHSQYRTRLAGILVNCFRESARRRGPRPLEASEGGRPRWNGAAPASAEADAIDVERALARLPDGYREVVVLHDLHGYTHQEIAALLDIEEGTSKSQLQRGRARLRELLTSKRGTA